MILGDNEKQTSLLIKYKLSLSNSTNNLQWKAMKMICIPKTQNLCFTLDFCNTFI